MAAALVTKTKVTWPVWKHFSFQPDQKGEKANLQEPTCKTSRPRVHTPRAEERVSARRQTLVQRVQTHTEP